MPYHDKNFAADAAISPAKFDPSKRRVFFDDFDGTDGADATLRPGWAAIASTGAGTKTAKTGSTDHYQGIVTITAGSGAGVARTDLYTDPLFSAYRDLRLAFSLPFGQSVDANSAARVGFATGTTVAAHEANFVGLEYNPALSSHWRLRVTIASTSAYLDTGITPVASSGVNDKTLVGELRVDGPNVSLTLNGQVFSLPGCPTSLRTWRALLSMQSIAAASKYLYCDFVRVTESREDVR